MTVYEKIKLMNIDELATWINDYGIFDYSPWVNWWDKTYCNKCESVIKDGCEYAWCEVNHKCRYFQEMDDIPNCEQLVKMWLELEDYNYE